MMRTDQELHLQALWSYFRETDDFDEMKMLNLNREIYEELQYQKGVVPVEVVGEIVAQRDHIQIELVAIESQKQQEQLSSPDRGIPATLQEAVQALNDPQSPTALTISSRVSGLRRAASEVNQRTIERQISLKMYIDTPLLQQQPTNLSLPTQTPQVEQEKLNQENIPARVQVAEVEGKDVKPAPPTEDIYVSEFQIDKCNASAWQIPTTMPNPDPSPVPTPTTTPDPTHTPTLTSPPQLAPSPEEVPMPSPSPSPSPLPEEVPTPTPTPPSTPTPALRVLPSPSPSPSLSPSPEEVPTPTPTLLYQELCKHSLECVLSGRYTTCTCSTQRIGVVEKQSCAWIDDISKAGGSFYNMKFLVPDRKFVPEGGEEDECINQQFQARVKIYNKDLQIIQNSQEFQNFV